MLSVRSLAGRLAAIAIILGASGALTSCRSDAPVRGPMNVVASINVWGDVLAQIGGPLVHVTSVLADPSADPHQQETDVKTAAQISAARLVVGNGLGYDEFFDSMVESSGKSGDSLVSVAGILGRSGSDVNPHLWYDFAALDKVADGFAAALGRIDPAHINEYKANAATFVANVAPLLTLEKAIRDKYDGTAIAYTERVAGYLVEQSGLHLGGPAGYPRSIEDGESPSAADQVAFDKALSTHAVKVLIYNAQVTSPITVRAKQAAEKAGIPVVGVTELLPPGEQDFQSWQKRQVQGLLDALGG